MTRCWLCSSMKFLVMTRGLLRICTFLRMCKKLIPFWDSVRHPRDYSGSIGKRGSCLLLLRMPLASCQLELFSNVLFAPVVYLHFLQNIHKSVKMAVPQHGQAWSEAFSLAVTRIYSVEAFVKGAKPANGALRRQLPFDYHGGRGQRERHWR